jgi:hypothetical protein
LELEEIIEILRKSDDEGFGDSGRTQYIIEKLEKNDELPKSDYIYVERMIKQCEEIVEEEPIEEIIENVSTEDLIKCYHCDLKINLYEKSIRKKDFWFHDKCYNNIPSLKTENVEKIQTVQKQVIKKIEVKRSYPQMVFSGGLLASLTGTVYFLAGDVIAATVGVCGSALYLATFKDQIIQKKRKNPLVVKTGIPGFDSALSAGLKKIVQC